MRRLVLLVFVAGVVGALFAGRASAESPPPLSFELSSASSFVRCAATYPATVTKSGQSCTITQPSGGTAWCIEYKSSTSPITQTCTIKQTSTTRANFTYVVQIAEQRGGTSPHDATQTASVEQGNTTRTNSSWVTQVVRQALGRRLDDDGDDWGPWSFAANANQIQNASQVADVCQGGVADCHLGAGMLSRNNSRVIQKQWQSEQAAARDSITQEQNTDAPAFCPAVADPANMCADVDQNSDPTASGKNDEDLNQLYVQLQNARGKGTAVTDQRQGGANIFSGGLAHAITQLGGGVANITTGQNSFQFQKANNVGSLFQKQDPRISKDLFSTQEGAEGSLWTGNQRAFQFQLEDGVFTPSFGGQHARLTYDADSVGGLISANLLVKQNDEPAETESCGPTPSCHILLDCTNVEPDLYVSSSEYTSTQECFREDID
jgi:hypothetical protein